MCVYVYVNMCVHVCLVIDGPLSSIFLWHFLVFILISLFLVPPPTWPLMYSSVCSNAMFI